LVPCLLVLLLGGGLAGCGSGTETEAGGHGEPSAEAIERNEEAEQKKEEAAEAAKDREVLSVVEGKKREETAEANAKRKEAAAAAKVKKREAAAEKALKTKEVEADARIKKAEEAAKAKTTPTTPKTHKGKAPVNKTVTTSIPSPSETTATTTPAG
jgi:hypothetical protein